VESGGRQRLSILADAFESVLGAVYLDQGFEAARQFIHKHLLAESDEIVADKRHTNYKSHLQEYVQSTYRTHPVYRIRSEFGPDHSKHFMVEVMVGRRTLGEGRGHNKKEAEQAAARDAIEKVERLRRGARADESEAMTEEVTSRRGAVEADSEQGEGRRRRRGRRGGRGRDHDPGEPAERERPIARASAPPAHEPVVEEYESEEDEVADEETFEAEPSRATSASEPFVDDLDDLDDEEEEDEEEDGEASDDDEDEEDDEDDTEDDEDDETLEEESEPSQPVRSAPPPARSPAPPQRGPAPASPVRGPAPDSYGRGSRRRGRRGPPPPPAESTGVVADAPEADVHEELHVDPFGIGSTAPASAVVDVTPTPAATGPSTAGGPDEQAREDRSARIDEIERALASFGRPAGGTGQPSGQGYGRKGRRRR